ncbi:MAG: hypothetical protein MI739_02280 [Bacteroidales bacterium]|nr:hypothetical protein [Bacteroidales bacterium]
MKNKILLLAIISSILNACISIPPQTVQLSRAIGNDLISFQQSHKNLAKLYFNKIETDINIFIDEVYTPFIINYVLKKELEKYKKGESSLYEAIEQAGKINGEKESIQALKKMFNFQEAAYNQIRKKREELLKPIKKQEQKLINNIDKSYENTIYANTTITNYLESASKLKKTQSEALSMIKLPNADSLITHSLVELSELVNTFVEKGKEIDIKSDNAYTEIKKISDKIKDLTSKNMQDE